MAIEILKKVVSVDAMVKKYIIYEGFAFTAVTYPWNVYDGIIIRYPYDVQSWGREVIHAKKSLDEYITFINENEIEKASIVADNIGFITECPTLKHLRIVPSRIVGDDFNYSPLYKMPEIKSLSCSTIYGEHGEFSTTLDYSKIRGLEYVSVEEPGDKNYNMVKTLKSLRLGKYNEVNLTSAFGSEILDSLWITQCKIKSLDGLQKSEKMQCLSLFYNRTLRDISALSKVKKTLKALRIENCPMIEDFSVLYELENLELLQLNGSNSLESLDFIKNMKKLKTFLFSMNVVDGDLSPCLNLSYVYSQRNRKHYNLKGSELPKDKYVRGNEDIEEWRRSDD